jgi:hypothetical protein
VAVIGRRETLRSAPKSFVFGLFEAIWDQNDLSHADFAPRGDVDDFPGTSHAFHAFDNSQPVASDSDRTAPRVLALGVSAPGGYSRVVEVSTRRQRSVAPSTRTITASLWLRARPRIRRCAAAWLHR